MGLGKQLREPTGLLLATAVPVGKGRAAPTAQAREEVSEMWQSAASQESEPSGTESSSTEPHTHLVTQFTVKREPPAQLRAYE